METTNTKNEEVIDFSNITSPSILKSIIKNLHDPKLVRAALRQYATFPETVVKNGFTSSNSRISSVIVEISDDRTFMLSYPSVIEEFYLNAKNPYGADDQNRFGYRKRSIPKAAKMPEVGLPIDSGELSTLVERTIKIISAFFNEGNSIDFTPNTEKSRTFFERCFVLCDGDATATERIRLKMRDLDTLLSAGPKKMLAAPEANVENIAESAQTPVVQDEFLKREFNYKNASEWKILKELRSLPAQEYSLKKDKRLLVKPVQAADIATSIADIYQDKIPEFIEKAKAVISGGRLYQKKLDEVSKWDYSKDIIPVHYLDPASNRGEEGYSSPKKGTFTKTLFVNYLTEVRKKIHEFTDEAGKHEFARIITERLGIYFPGDIVLAGFLGREWALDTAKRLGIDIESIPEVRIARMNIDPCGMENLADKNADRLLEEIKKVKSNETAGLFAKYSEYMLFCISDNNRKRYNELDGAMSSHYLLQAYDHENGIDNSSRFGSNVGGKYAERFYGNPKVVEAFKVHLGLKSTYETIFPNEVKISGVDENISYRFLSGVGNGSYYLPIRKPYTDLITDVNYDSWDEAVKVAWFVLAGFQGLGMEASQISDFLFSIPDDEVLDKKLLVKLYSHYDRSEIAETTKARVRGIFAKSDEGKLVSSLIESGALDEAGAEDVMVSFVNDCKNEK